jgi:hypothetical protein
MPDGINIASRINDPGIYEIDEAAYHADPVIEPSLSHSIAKLLINRSPRHAFSAHPRFTAQEEDECTAVMDAGTALHKLILGKGQEITAVPFDDYKKQAAKDARDQARTDRRVPILASKMPQVLACAKEAEEQIREHPDLRGFYAPGRSEVMAVWREGNVWCRSLIDRISDTGQVYDLKTTLLSAAPWDWEQRLRKEYATQDAFYRRGLIRLGIEAPPALLFIPIEQEPPYCLSSIAADSTLRFWAESEIERAIDVWRECITTGVWPRYPATTYHVGATGWMLDKQEERASASSFKPKRPSPEALQFGAGEFQ